MKPKKVTSASASLALEMKRKLLSRLKELGIQESELIVACVRKHRPNQVGYYSHLSQFRGRARIVVDATYILGHYLDLEDARLEVYRTIAHEYGHIMAEAIRELPRMGDGTSVFALPAWQLTFNSDEELFAESFADFCCEPELCGKIKFWETYMPLFSSEFMRLFGVPELD